MALFHTELERDGPGLLYRDILKRQKDTQLAASRIAKAHADVIILLGIDYDYHGLAIQALAAEVAQVGGPVYSTRFALRPNSGVSTGLDLDGDGRTGEPEDAQGYGSFSGRGGMAILSRWPVDVENVENYSAHLWAGFEWSTLPRANGQLFPSTKVYDHLRLSTTGHWIVPLLLPDGQRVRIAAYHATPPVFDGPEDRNGLRNADETLFWVHHLNTHPDERLIITGGANLDPERSEGRRSAIRALLEHPYIQDPFSSDSLTVDWSDIGLGRMRTDYILPTHQWGVLGLGTIWPQSASDQESRHALIWVDLEMRP